MNSPKPAPVRPALSLPPSPPPPLSLLSLSLSLATHTIMMRIISLAPPGHPPVPRADGPLVHPSHRQRRIAQPSGPQPRPARSSWRRPPRGADRTERCITAEPSESRDEAAAGPMSAEQAGPQAQERKRPATEITRALGRRACPGGLSRFLPRQGPPGVKACSARHGPVCVAAPWRGATPHASRPAGGQPSRLTARPSCPAQVAGVIASHSYRPPPSLEFA